MKPRTLPQAGGEWGLRSGLIDLGTKPDRFQSAALANQSLKRRQFCRRRKLQIGKIGRTIETCDRNRPDGGFCGGRDNVHVMPSFGQA